MARWLVGDVQGCDAALGRLLDRIGFSPSRDTLYLLGDLVNRGPESAQVLRRLMACGDSAKSLLGNHDLSLLAIAYGLRAPHRNDTLDAVLQARDRGAMLEWLRHRSMALSEAGLLMVHGGVLPQWDAARVMALAGEVEEAVRGPDIAEFLRHMYGNEPDRWDDSLTGAARLRVIVNALTRVRFVTPEGAMDLKASGGLDKTPPGYLPWFDVPGRRSANVRIAFGHWSTLGLLVREDIIALDTGCVWGGCLSAICVETMEVVQVKCDEAQAPGE
ncbi:MAG TPA: symmetrical bis(5'-nucleosyl)-tetraphosphatase [Ramlibacter sp.]|uniref:symmetrical bis(5'-nucleosyl)-tetraphosphatase n=1 Tax=Ramlibacter sp. TaxID=1917967 RepID=UPI002BF5F395|nr:symmetrical bis(5'-nucleosyl)-tetraphosphatase [Ramlibacter sp.]HVZ45995.1 symmetrical bis(5'-nucleosyl)-tetraphosphatase [Ramlibacter sp.]